MPNQIDFRLRYQVRKDTPHGTLFKYLQSKETRVSYSADGVVCVVSLLADSSVSMVWLL